MAHVWGTQRTRSWFQVLQWQTVDPDEPDGLAIRPRGLESQAMTEAESLRYCPVCASELELQLRGDYEDATHPTCGACGFTLWQNPKPTVDALVLRDSDGEMSLLLGRRTTEPAREGWDTPGGFVNPGDRIEEVVLRECRREFGVEVEMEVLVGAFDDEYSGDQTVALVYACRYVSGEPRALGPPVDEVRWFPIDALPPIGFPVIARAIEVYRDRLQADE